VTGVAAIPAQQHCYDVHGVVVAVRAHQRAALDAMELRLRGFRCQDRARPDVRIEFATDDHEDDLSPDAGRPVYDTPFGSLRYVPEADALHGELAGVRLVCRPADGVATLRSAAFAGRDLYLATHPLATIALMELLERRGLFSLHAACLANDDRRGLLLAGPSGSGKSTLALALARAGMAFLSDDLVLLAPQAGSAGVRARGFADAVGLTPHAAERFAELRAALDAPPADGFPKRLRRIEELFGPGAAPLRACTPVALVFPRVARGRPSRLEPLDPREALLRLVPDVLATEPRATHAHLAAIGALLEQVRCYALDSGSDLERAAALVRDLAA
jgi:hypothetical protein